MAHDVMTFTNRLADQNRTILATIHQVRCPGWPRTT
jgi:archaellum biogenesis ATPase FlaH